MNAIEISCCGGARARHHRPAFADITVHVLRVSTTTGPAWQAIADAYNKAHPGTTVVFD